VDGFIYSFLRFSVQIKISNLPFLNHFPGQSVQTCSSERPGFFQAMGQDQTHASVNRLCGLEGVPQAAVSRFVN
jgi:hypothetical protein